MRNSISNIARHTVIIGAAAGQPVQIYTEIIISTTPSQNGGI